MAQNWPFQQGNKTMSNSYQKGLVAFWGRVNARLIERGEESISHLEAQLFFETAVTRAVDAVIMDRAGWRLRKPPKVARLRLVTQ
jgi:hypothetical protein